MTLPINRIPTNALLCRMGERHNEQCINGQWGVQQGRTGGNGLHVEAEHGEHGLQAHMTQIRAKCKSEAERIDDRGTSKQKVEVKG
jgi:hypothetical protein